MIQVINPTGINALPMIKYNSVERVLCTIRLIKKDIASGSQGKHITIHVIPTNNNRRFLRLKYLPRIVKPITNESTTKIRLKLP
jgi:hypothetical protein